MLTQVNFSFNDMSPSNIEAEEAILGGILLDPGAVSRVADSLSANAFFIRAHQIIFQSVIDLYSKNQPTDFLTVTAWLADRKLLEKVGGQGKVLQLVERTVSAANIDQYAELVKELHQRRKLIETGNAIIGLAQNRAEEFDSIALAARNLALETTEIKRWEPTQKLAKSKLDITKILHPKLATPLKLLSKHFPFPEEICIHNLLPIVASLMKSNSSVCVRKSTNHHEKFILRSVIIAEASNRKSAIENIFTEPLYRLQEEQNELFATTLTAYEEEVQAWEKLSAEEQRKNPEKRPGQHPSQRHYIYTGGSKEGVWEILSKQPERGILHAPDEILQVVSSRGEYSRGKSSDQDYSLSGYNGRKNTIIRKGKTVVFKDSSSLLGGIQPGKVAALNGNDTDDSRGELSRYLPLFFDIQPFYTPDEEPDIDISQLLTWIYREIDQIPEKTYSFNRRTKRLFCQWQRQCEHFRINLPSPSLRAFVGKLEGNTVKIAALLHVLWSICEGQPVESEIEEQHLRSAIQIANFYYIQACRLRDAAGEISDPIKSAIIEKLKLEGMTTAGKLQSWSRLCRKKSCTEIYKRFEELSLNHPDIVEVTTNKKGALELRLKISPQEFASVVSVEAESFMEGGFPSLTIADTPVSEQDSVTESVLPPSLTTDTLTKTSFSEVTPAAPTPPSSLTIADTPVSEQDSVTESVLPPSLTTDTVTKTSFSEVTPASEPMALIPTFDPNIEAYKIFHDKHTNSARVFIADIKNKLQVEALGKECLSKQIAQHYNIEKCGTDWLLVLSPVTTEGIEALVHLLTPDSTPAPEPNPTPVPYYLAEEHIIGWVENLREVAQLNDWISIEAIMDGLAEPLKEAVWERLDVSERNAIKELKRAATQKPEPTPTQTNKPEPRTKERRVKIPREAKLEKGQSIVSEDGEIIGKVILVKNAHSADVRFYKKSIIKRTKKSDLDTYSYHREWIIGEEWAETFYLKVEGGYKAKFWEINKSQWHLTILRNGLIVTQYILREPEIYQYDSPREWAESRVKLFLETM